jgi:DNA-binding CsgD family transcriptional regulator
VDPQSFSMSTSLGALALRAARAEPPARIAIVCDDLALASVLRRNTLLRSDLEESDSSSAAVIITDHPLGETGAPVLIVGSDDRPGPGENAIRSLDPVLILSAAALVASGHRIEPANRAEKNPASRLSARERQVVDLLVEGASNKVIARQLDISVHTAKFHVAAVLDKLGARNRADAVAIVLRDGVGVV